MLTVLLTSWELVFGCCHVISSVNDVYTWDTKAECDEIIRKHLSDGKKGDPKLWSCRESDKPSVKPPAHDWQNPEMHKQH